MRTTYWLDIEIHHHSAEMLMEFEDAFSTGNVGARFVPEPDYAGEVADRVWRRLIREKNCRSLSKLSQLPPYFGVDLIALHQYRDRWRKENWGGPVDMGGADFDVLEHFDGLWCYWNSEGFLPLRLFEGLQKVGFELDVVWCDSFRTYGGRWLDGKSWVFDSPEKFPRRLRESAGLV